MIFLIVWFVVGLIGYPIMVLDWRRSFDVTVGDLIWIFFWSVFMGPVTVIFGGSRWVAANTKLSTDRVVLERKR